MPKEELVTVLFTLKTLPPAQKEMDKMDKDQVQKIYDHIEQLKIDPFRKEEVRGQRIPASSEVG